MKETYLPLLFAFLLASFSGKENKKIYLEYTSPDKKISIDNTVIYLTESIEEYDNPVSAVPSKRTEVTKKGIISQTSLNSLTKLIKTNGFLNLKKTVYGPSEEDRYYPYSLYVKTGTKEKKVVYRSNPSSESAPKEFSQIEQELDNLCKSIAKWETVPALKK